MYSHALQLPSKYLAYIAVYNYRYCMHMLRISFFNILIQFISVHVSSMLLQYLNGLLASVKGSRKHSGVSQYSDHQRLIRSNDHLLAVNFGYNICTT